MDTNNPQPNNNDGTIANNVTTTVNYKGVSSYNDSLAASHDSNNVFVSPIDKVVKRVKRESDDDDSTVTPTRLIYDDNGSSKRKSHTSDPTVMIPAVNSDGKVRSYVITKVVKKETANSKSDKVKKLVSSLCTEVVVNDTPLCSVTSRHLKYSDYYLVELKDIELEDDVPVYQLFGYGRNLKLSRLPEGTLEVDDDEQHARCDCNECEYADICDEYQYGPYCVAAVKRYYEENKFFATTKDAYIVFVSHYNRALDFKSFDRFNERKGVRPSDVTKPPLCMREGSLRHSLHWVKWQIENGSEKAYYQEMKIRKRRAKKMKEAEEAAKAQFRYHRHKDSK